MDGLSKSYAMTGWRLGYAVAPRALAAKLDTLMINSSSCAAAFTQIAAIEALGSPESEHAVRRMVKVFEHRRDLVVDGLNEIPGMRCARPQGAFYAFPNIEGTGFDEHELANRLLNEAGVAVLPGTAQVAAGYVMYGPATQLVLTAGAGVHVFTLDRARGEFVLTQPGVRIPARGRTYSINEGNTAHWVPEVAGFVRHLKAIDVASGRPYTARYAGSLVADFHRMLLEGGVFLYPADAAGQGKLTSGKLRLQYEAAPIALVAETAGGRASTGTRRILELEPASPHARVSLIVGSPEDVALAEDFYAQRH